jgi:hypothetical protein
VIGCGGDLGELQQCVRGSVLSAVIRQERVMFESPSRGSCMRWLAENPAAYGRLPRAAGFTKLVDATGDRSTGAMHWRRWAGGPTRNHSPEGGIRTI